jgi:adenosylhomocysteine nucleosidase
LSLDLKVDPASLATTPGVYVGPLVTVSQVVSTPEEKRALGAAHQALAVDMESWAVAEMCRQAQVRCLCVRVISDPADELIPADVGSLAMQKTMAGRLGAATGALWRRPSSFKDMWRLKETALESSDRLARFLADMVRQFEPPPLA